eukprot:comp20998_c0_seq1/m.28158 comp20998_c0_seq1/g.28158  ORF comp20998_c0_seq1/g.28158 comp20998_c0_seq1/m.28158 type:complete len:745 (-) comp20998_c0_seq1:702-2936(-)
MEGEGTAQEPPGEGGDVKAEPEIKSKPQTQPNPPVSGANSVPVGQDPEIKQEPKKEGKKALKSKSSMTSASEEEVFTHDPSNVRRTEKIEKAEARLQTNPYDTDAWAAILNEVHNANLDTFRCYYEKFLKLFPTSGRHWKVYMEREIKAKNYGRVEKLFKLNLLQCLSMEFWRCYLAYVRETKADQPNFREIMRKVFDFAIDNIGQDLNSTPIWQDYIEFLKDWPAANTYEEGQKMTALRQVYQKAVVNPIMNVEQLWKEYDQYENGLNKLTAKKLLQERSAAYMTARSVARERKTRSENLQRNMLAVPPKGTAKERQQLKAWRDYIEWEKSNPLRLDSAAQLERRVTFAFKQCLMYFYHYQEIWFDYARHLEDSNKKETAGQIYERGCTVLPNNMLLHFAHADYEEGRKNNAKAAAIYDKLLENKNIDDLTLVYVQYTKFKKRTTGIAAARLLFKKARLDPRCQFHIYIINAMLEYMNAKDSDVPMKVFGFGMRHYQSSFDYVDAYTNFAVSIPQDHQARVLFEQVVNTLKPEDVGPIWTKFLRFESDFGDLASVQKVEKRRQEYAGGPAILQAIERYRYMDLYPCSDLELDLGGYVKAKEGAHVASQQSNAAAAMQDDQNYPLPDLSQWVAYNPEAGRLPVNEPGVLRDLLRQLPPPTSFTGPYAHVDMLLSMLENITNLPVLPNADPAKGSGKEGGNRKRRKEEADSDEEGAPTEPQAQTARAIDQDIFRKRQRQQIMDNQ